MSADPHRDEATKHWLVRRRTIRRLWVVFVAVLALTVLADLVADRHGKFGIDGSFGFAAWYGFITCVAMIAGAKALGLVLQRRDTFYDDD